MRTHYTDKQIKLNNWINEIGFQTEMEKVFGKYCVDIYLPELAWVVELDGFGHWPKKEKKRDSYLLNECYVNNVVHIEYKLATKEYVEQVIKDELERIYGKNWIEKGNKSNT